MSSQSRKPLKLNDAYRVMLKTVSGSNIGVSRQRLFAIREAVGHGDFPKDTTMREHLALAGWKRVRDEEWM